MAYFLKDERRQALIEELVEYRISRDKAERITLITEDEADRHWYAHALICNDTIGDVDHSTMAACACLWSFCIVAAINEEARERGMLHEDFPLASAVMSVLMPKIKAKEAGLSLPHTLH